MLYNTFLWINTRPRILNQSMWMRRQRIIFRGIHPKCPQSGCLSLGTCQIQPLIPCTQPNPNQHSQFILTVLGCSGYLSFLCSTSNHSPPRTVNKTPLVLPLWSRYGWNKHAAIVPGVFHQETWRAMERSSKWSHLLCLEWRGPGTWPSVAGGWASHIIYYKDYIIFYMN